jgi:hypothetical protein
MRSYARLSLLALLAGAIVASCATAAQAEFGIKSFEAGTCNSDVPECTYTAAESQFYTQSAGHPQLGITGVEVNTAPSGEPEGKLKDVRVDIPPGLSVNPEAAPQCTQAEFNSVAGCKPEAKVGEDEITAFVGVKVGPLSLPIYNLVPAEGVPAEFGFKLEAPLVSTRILIVGGVSWYHEPVTAEDSGVPTGDYHEYFTIKEIPTTLSIVKTRLKFTGTAGNGTFITMPSLCGPQRSYLHVDSHEAPGQFQARPTVSGEPPKAVSVGGCENVPFAPSLSLTAGIGEQAADQPDGVGVDLHVPQNPNGAGSPNSSDLQLADVTLPEGMTLDPSAAHDLEGCTEEQIAIGTAKAVSCPAASELGTVTIETPVLPKGSLKGAVYLGLPAGGPPITGPPYTIYLDAESARYGVSVRLKGLVSPDLSTGRLTTTFSENPQQPFEDLILNFKRGARAPIANPLICAPAPLSGFTPYTGQSPASSVLSSPFSAGSGSACSSTAPFSLSQGTQAQPATAGADTSYTFNLTRTDGQQYLSQLKTVLPAGLVGAIPTVTLCGEPQANGGGCTVASQIGTVTVVAGAGSEPFPFTGNVYLTGPYEGAPYGLSIVVPPIAGPFHFGNVIARARIEVDPHTARVIATDDRVPRIVGGIPIRIKSLTISMNRQGFERNPTNCGVLATESTLTSTLGATQTLSTPFQVGGCNTLAFKPSFSASTGAKTSKANGASLEVNVRQAGGANMRSVTATLPKALPTRLTTLQKACTEAVFAANPLSCPAASNVGTATVVTPLLPGTLKGPGYLVSHGGAAFPDLDLILDGSGVRVILVGNTDIKKGVTTSTFATIPDVPVSSFALNLPVGPHSALAATGDLCTQALVMPTTITAQNGAQVKQRTKIAVVGCGVRIVGHRIVRHTLILTVRTFAAGRISGKGANLKTTFRRLAKATNAATLKVSLSRSGQSRRRPLRVRVRVGFLPKQRGASSSAAFVTVTFR